MAINDVLRNFGSITDEIERRTKQAVYETGANLLNESKQVTPFDTGDLRDSGKMRMEKTPKGWNAVVTYGDGVVDYAAKVHEDIHVQFHEPGTGAKYLENPLKTNTRRYLEYIRNAAKEGVR